jgi:hypothetical protein
MPHTVNTLIAELNTAIAHDEGAKAEAMKCGLDALQPLSLFGLRELCVLGERMTQTAALRLLASIRLQAALDHERAVKFL